MKRGDIVRFEGGYHDGNMSFDCGNTAKVVGKPDKEGEVLLEFDDHQWSFAGGRGPKPHRMKITADSLEMEKVYRRPAKKK